MNTLTDRRSPPLPPRRRRRPSRSNRRGVNAGRPPQLAKANTAEGWMAAESRLPVFPTPAKGRRVPPGVFGLDDEAGHQFVRVVDTDTIPDYDVVATPELFNADNPTLSCWLQNAKCLYVVLDGAVADIYGEDMKAYLDLSDKPYHVYTLPRLGNNEENKSLESWVKLHTWLMEKQIRPTDLLVGIGGGVTSDLVGYAASSTRRGVPYLFVATTLTAMIDAGISPKTAINVGRHKNSCGSVYPPRCVLSDTSLLKTDPSIKTGLAEMIKLAIVRSEKLFALLEREGIRFLQNRLQSKTGSNVIELAQRLFLKMKFEHPFPGNRPASLRSFGHAFSRRLEGLTRYMLTHGEAIGVEMAVAASLACEVSAFPRMQRDRIVALLERLGLLPYCPECNADEIWPVFADRIEADEPLWFPIPDGEIGRGTFLRRFSKTELADAISSVPQIRSRASLTGRVEYLSERADSRPPVRVMAEFFEDGSCRFSEKEFGDVRWYPFERALAAEETFAYRLAFNSAHQHSVS